MRGRSSPVVALTLGLLILLVFATPAFAAPLRADEGWVIDSFDAQIGVQPNGDLLIVETILVDFGTQHKHGIFRDIPVLFDYDQQRNRVYDLDVQSVTSADGKGHQYEVSSRGAYREIKIGDPNVTVSGRQSYRITYRVQHALNGFSDHDELYWNVNGDAWPVLTSRATATVTLPGGAVQRVTCYQGTKGSTEPCRFGVSDRTATFQATRTLPPGEQLTVVVALPKGLVPNPEPHLERKPRESLVEYFEVTPLTVGGALLALATMLGWIGRSWWVSGRDRRYTSVYYLTDNPNEETRPLGASDPIVVEFEPPDKLRPAQLGLVLDERADTLDVTATIVDLAVRGYLHIAEMPKHFLFGKRDWQLSRTGKPEGDLLAYEQTVLKGLFADGSPVKLSALKNEFYTHLNAAETDLYRDAVTRGWFARRPDKVRSFWKGLGVALMVAGGVAADILGKSYGAGLIGIPIVLGGLLMLPVAAAMPSRTARGREVLRRTLGFRQYVATAEKDRQRFNEQQNLFAEYLPYAIVFRCVDKWARAFKDIDTLPAVSTWYTGAHAFNAGSFSRNLEGFSSTLASTIASTPGGSGSSGFSGGGAGGGGGGGGGGSW